VYEARTGGGTAILREEIVILTISEAKTS